MLNKFFIFIYDNGIYDQEVYKYFFNNAIQFDYYEEDMLRNNIGCNLVIDKKNDILIDVIPFIPRMVDDITTLINIHEYVHTLCLYKNLNKKYKDSVILEVLPMYYEKLFAMEHDSDILRSYEAKLDDITLNSNDKKYLSALKICYQLLDGNKKNNSFKKINRIAKNLSKNIY